jgi:hypothetical protein
MTNAQTPPLPTASTGSARRTWTRPQVHPVETRPEVTAYAGDSGPWNAR